MNWIKMGLILCCGIALGYGGAYWISCKNPKETLESAKYEDWLRLQIQKIDQLRVGSTRKELLTLFEQQGGLFRPEKCRFYFREISCIHLHVEFECQKNERGRTTANPDDKIISISPPFLASGLTLD